MAEDGVEKTDLEKNGEEEEASSSKQTDEVADESKAEKEDKQESMECDEEPIEDSKTESPKPVENADDNVPPSAEDKPKEPDQTNSNSNDNDNEENKNIPENFKVMQMEKKPNDKSVEEPKESQSSRISKEDTPATNGNEESQCSVYETTTEIRNCYCGQERNLNTVELQCGSCSKWFHEQCLNIFLGKCVPFMTSYTFFCKQCNPNGIETFSKKQSSFSQMCCTAIANLMQQSTAEGNPRKMFSKDKEVIPYIVTNWEHLTTMPRRIKQTWHNTVYKAMLKDSDVFICEEKGFDSASDSLYPMFGLVNQDLAKIPPSYESQGRGPQKFNIDSSSSQGGSSFTGSKSRSSKRKVVDNQISGPGKKVKSDLVMPKLPPNGYPSEHPFNKDGYRYILAEPDPHAPYRQEFEEGQDWDRKPIPGFLYRKLTPNKVLIALHDRAPQLKVSEDRLSITGEKGYCMARATHGVNRGTWYFECTIEDMPTGAATRLGWSQPLGNLQCPLGYDKFSYSWRSHKGSKFHESKGFHYCDEGYGQGDTLGFLIHLPETQSSIPLPPTYKDKPLFKFKSYLYYEEKDEVRLALKKLKPLGSSKMVFYKNGKSMGAAFEDINIGTYYPAVSLFKNVTVSLNFGPNFKYPPQEKFKPICNLADEAAIEQAMSDILFFTEKKGKLSLDNPRTSNF